MRPDHGTRGVRILGLRGAVVTDREPLAPAERAEVVVEGVILHHQHDDVLDLRQHVGTGRTGGIGPLLPPVMTGPPLPPTQLLALDPLPATNAGHISPSFAVRVRSSCWPARSPGFGRCPSCQAGPAAGGRRGRARPRTA